MKKQMEKKINNIMSVAGWNLSTETWETPIEEEDFETYVNISDENCKIPKVLIDNIWQEAQKEVINKAELILQKKEAQNFCSCYEGDLYDNYKEGVKEFLKELHS